MRSDGSPPREQHSERPALAMTRASVCVQKIGCSFCCVHVDKVSIRSYAQQSEPGLNSLEQIIYQSRAGSNFQKSVCNLVKHLAFVAGFVKYPVVIMGCEDGF